MPPRIISKCPISASGNEIRFHYADVENEDRNPAAEIESGHKLYKLVTWNSDTLEVTYTRTQENPAMTTPTPPTPDRMNAAELRSALESIVREMTAIRQDIDGISLRLIAATERANQPAPANNAPTVEFIAETVSMGYSTQTGKPDYFIKGGRYTEHGVRIWPEVYALLADKLPPIDELKPGPNPIPHPFPVRAETGEYKDKTAGEIKQGVKKIIG